MSGKCAAPWSGATTLAEVKESLEHFSAILEGAAPGRQVCGFCECAPARAGAMLSAEPRKNFRSWFH
jgi:hypothetical protein